MAITTPAAPRLAETNRPFPRMTWPAFDPRICPCPRGSSPLPMGIRTAQPAIPDVPTLLRTDPTLIPIDSCASIQLYHTPRPFCPAIDCDEHGPAFYCRRTSGLPPLIRFKLPLASPPRHQAHIHVTCSFRLCHPWQYRGCATAATRLQPLHPCSGQPLRILAEQRRLLVGPEIGFPTSNTTPGQRYFPATDHPWQRFAAPRHGLTAIRHIPVPEIRAAWISAVSDSAPTAYGRPSMAGPDLP